MVTMRYNQELQRSVLLTFYLL